jgi:hypothetical protein
VRGWRRRSEHTAGKLITLTRDPLSSLMHPYPTSLRAALARLRPGARRDGPECDPLLLLRRQRLRYGRRWHRSGAARGTRRDRARQDFEALKRGHGAAMRRYALPTLFKVMGCMQLSCQSAAIAPCDDTSYRSGLCSTCIPLPLCRSHAPLPLLGRHGFGASAAASRHWESQKGQRRKRRR